MTASFGLRFFCALCMSAGFAWAVDARYDEAIPKPDETSKGERYRPIVLATLLPTAMVIWPVIGLILSDKVQTLRIWIGVCFGIFLQISVYYAVLLLALPLLRRHICARSCALLWLLPTYLYLTLYNNMEASRPLLILRLSGSWIWVVLGVWTAGFAGILVWKTVEHFCFRRCILKHAVPVTDSAVLEIWQEEIKSAGIKKAKFRLLLSPDVTSPLTIGLSRRSMRVVLPLRAYTPDELHLIFRHEMIHICRGDSVSKFFLTFCTALCWFNPLMWRAMRNSAEDMELSCDESVLQEADSATRREYANLLLASAGDGRGYTTCLSAAASSMRYRLQAVVKPRERSCGVVLLGIILFVLLITNGYVALAYGGQSGDAALFAQEREAYTLKSLTLETGDERTQPIVVDEEALLDYLSGLEMQTLTGKYAFEGYDRILHCYFERGDRWMFADFTDSTVRIVTSLKRSSGEQIYALAQPLDWVVIDRLLVDPELSICLTQDGVSQSWDITATLDRLTRLDGGEEAVVYASATPNDTPNGVYGPEPTQALLTISYPLCAPLRLTAENESRSQRTTLTWRPSESGRYVMTLPENTVHYSVVLEFQTPDGSRYRAEYRFDIGV